MVAQKKLLIIDDDELLQSYLHSFFGERGYFCHQLNEGDELPSYFNEQDESPDLILLDVLMSGHDGFHWLKWLRKEYPKIPVIMLTGENKGEDRVRGLRSGAIDYISKPFNSEELFLRVQNILRLHDLGDKKDKLFFGPYCYNFNVRELRKQDKSVHLTENEKRLLIELCQNYGEIVSREALNKAIGVEEYHPLDRRIDVHISRLRNKLENISGKSKYIHVVRNNGYFLRYFE
ncbi:MAG: response regulator transcription factor [Cocleimonas sp.]|nr:response regulator transcription factor [Cocleimonas sp.]